MMPAMVASMKDCSANKRMFVSSIRCTTISSWITSMPAANNVIHCEASSEWEEFISLKQEGGQQGQRSQNESRREQIRHAKQAQLGIGGFDQHHRSRDQGQFGRKPEQRQGCRGRGQLRRDPYREKDVHQ